MMASLDGVTFLANSDGIMTYEGTDDLGQDIDCNISTGFIHFNTDKLKRFNTNSIYVSFLTDTDGTFTADTSTNGLDASASFSIDFTTSSPEMTRIPIPDGMKGRYWRFTIANRNGSPFTVEEINLNVSETGRAIK